MNLHGSRACAFVLWHFRWRQTEGRQTGSGECSSAAGEAVPLEGRPRLTGDVWQRQEMEKGRAGGHVRRSGLRGHTLSYPWGPDSAKVWPEANSEPTTETTIALPKQQRWSGRGYFSYAFVCFFCFYLPWVCSPVFPNGCVQTRGRAECGDSTRDF